MARRPRTGGGPLRPLFIASLGHSGSTLIDLLLGAHSELVAVGEVDTLFRRLDDPGVDPGSVPCSCGRSLGDCPLWGPLLDPLARAATREDRYRLVVEQVTSLFGAVAPVDASKNLAALRSLQRVAGDVLVVSLVRDVRSWTVRYRERARERGELGWRDLVREHGAKAPLVRYRRTPTQLFRLWYDRNRAIDEAVTDLGLDRVAVGYEELVYDPVTTLERVLDRAGYGYEPSVVDPRAGGDHLAFSNRMAYGDEGRSSIGYDPSWRRDRSWRRAARRSPVLMAYNDERAYGRVSVPWRTA